MAVTDMEGSWQPPTGMWKNSRKLRFPRRAIRVVSRQLPCPGGLFGNLEEQLQDRVSREVAVRVQPQDSEIWDKVLSDGFCDNQPPGGGPRHAYYH